MYSLVQSPIVSRKQYDLSLSERMPKIEELSLETSASWTPKAGSLSQYGIGGMKKIEESVPKNASNTQGINGTAGRRANSSAPFAMMRPSRGIPPRRNNSGRRRTRASTNNQQEKMKAGLFVKGLDLTAG